MSLKVQSRMYVLTPNGEREIQLCVGDITALPVKDAVDVILISAFPNDYIPMRTSVIGSLKHNLGISVRNLAMNKKEDLRRQFNCWISHMLPPGLPYRQVLCFERQTSNTVDVLDAVKEIFRAMMPIFNNENKSIITPLLATGFQDVDEVKMLQRLVKSAEEWMQMGLGLQTMKVVLYSADPEKLSSYEWKLISKFNQWKKRAESGKSWPKNPDIKYDIFLVYTDQDINISKKVTEKLKTHKKSVKILTATELTTKKETWQHDIFMAMISCVRVVPLLNSAFLESSACIDQYNIALCCNRLTHRHILAPLQLQRTKFPLYMGMVQWIKCSPEDSTLEKASMILIEQISIRSVDVLLHYDIFISYSHRNHAAAKVFLQMFQKLNPDLKVFFDYDALKTGVSWQQALYDSVDASRCVVSLLSTDYFTSPMCTEEFHMSLTKHLAKEKELELVTVCLEPVRHLVLGEYLQPVKAYEKELSEVAMTTCAAICDWLKTGTKTEVFSKAMDPVDIDETAERSRELLYHKMYTLEKNQFILMPTSQTKEAAQNNGTMKQVKANENEVPSPKPQTNIGTKKMTMQRKASASKPEAAMKKDIPKQESQRRRSIVKLDSSTTKMTPKLDTSTKKVTPNHSMPAKPSSLKKELPAKKVNPKQELQAKKENTKEILQTDKLTPKEEVENKKTNEDVQTSRKEETPGAHSVSPDKGRKLYLSYTLSDQKYASLLDRMLRKKSPYLSMNIPGGGNEAELIEAANYIVVFLSNKYLQSRKQMDEFSLILSKQRINLGHRIMYVIWLNYIPPKPTYVHLVPADTVLTDVLWCTLVQRLRESGNMDVFTEVASERAVVEKEFRWLEDSDVLAILKVTCDVSALIHTGRPQHNLAIENVTLMNVIQLHKDLEKLETEAKQTTQKTASRN